MSDDLVQRLRHDVGVLADKLAAAQNRIKALEAALREISETPNCGWHCVASDVGRIAREALDA